MKTEYVAVYLNADQANLIRWTAQEAVLAADDDLEVVQKLHDVIARCRAREAIISRRDIYKEIVDKAQEACDMFLNGECECIDE